jgi:hypothetical protein
MSHNEWSRGPKNGELEPYSLGNAEFCVGANQSLCRSSIQDRLSAAKSGIG